MSYVSQIMCYACTQTFSEVYSQPAPTSSEVSQFNLAGWTDPDWPSASANWGSWTRFCAARLFNGNEKLAKTWTVGPNATLTAVSSTGTPLEGKACWLDPTGESPVLKADDGVSNCKIAGGTSVCGELWYHLATGGRHDLCSGC